MALICSGMEKDLAKFEQKSLAYLWHNEDVDFQTEGFPSAENC